MAISEKRQQEIRDRQAVLASKESAFDKKRRESLENRLAPAVQGGLLRGDGTRNTGDEVSQKYGALSKVGQKLDGSVSGIEKLQKYQKAGLHPKSGGIGASSPTSRIVETFDHLEAKPPSAEGFDDPKDYQVALSKWEAAQATKQANAIAKATIGIRGQQEAQQTADTESFFKEQGGLGQIKGAGKVMNPEFQKLTEEERALNKTLPQGQRIEEYVSFGEQDLDEGQRQALSEGRNVMITEEQRQRGFTGSVPSRFTDPETGKVIKTTMGGYLDNVKSFLGAEAGDVLDVRSDGTYFLKTKEGEEVDPIKRAESKVKEQEQEANERLDSQFKTESDRIRNMHRTATGRITTQGKRELVELQNKYNKDKQKISDSASDLLETNIKAEKERQIQVETNLSALSTPKTKSFSEEISQAKVDRLNDLKAQGYGDFEALAKVEQEYAKMKQDPQSLKISKIIGEMEARGAKGDEIFKAIYDETKSTDEAYKVIKDRFGEAQAKNSRNDFLRQRGWDEETIAEEDYSDTINDLYNGELGGYLGLTKLVKESKSLGMSDEFILSQIEAIEESPKSDVTTKIMAKTFKKAYQPDEADIVDSGSVENWGFAVLDGRAKLSNVPAEIRTKVNDFAQTKVQKGYVPENPVLTELQQTKSAKMLKDFNGIANTIGIFDVKQGMDTLNAIYGGDGIEKASGLTDIAAVNAFQRMIDPGATVREGDVDLIESAVPVFARFAPGFQWKKLKEGLKMPPEMRKKMLEEATKVYNKKAQEFDKGVGNKFMLQAEQAGIPFYLVGEKFYDEDQAGYQEFLRENFGDDWQEYDSSANKVIWEKEQGGELKEVIGQAESGGNYNAIYGNATQSDIDFSKKTMAEILQIQKDHVASGQPSSAIGKYQFIQGTLKGLINELGMTGQELFTPEVQDKMFQQLLLRRGYNQYKAGEITLEQFQENLAKEWASLPKDKTGLSYYEGDGLNKALITPEQLQSSITG